MKPSFQMKRLIITFISAAFLLVVMQNCSKGGGGGGGCSEAAMTVVATPAINSTEPAAPGPDFPLQINITANKPSAGVTIEIKAHPDGSATNFYTYGPTATTSANNSFTITGTPSGVACKVDIIVTSKSCNTNKFTGSYTYSKK